MRKLARLRRALAASRRRVPGRRPPPRLRLPALALVPRARREARPASTRAGRAARGDRARAGGVPRRLGVREGGLPLGLGRARGAARPGLDVLASPPGAAARTRPSRCPATLSRQLLVPAVIALFFAYVAERSLAGTRDARGRDAGPRARPPDLRALRADPARRVRGRADAARPRRGRSRAPPRSPPSSLPAAAVALWLRPIAKRDRFGRPRPRTSSPRALAHYKGQLDVLADGSYRLAPELFGRAGAIAVMALFAVPLAVFGARRRWGAFVLGGFLAVLAAVARADAVHALRRRRVDLAGAPRRRLRAVPVRDRGRRRRARAAALARRAPSSGSAAGIAFQLAYPGDFGYALDEGGPGCRDVGRALRRRRRARRSDPSSRAASAELDRMGPIAAATAALAILPVALHGFTHWDERPTVAPRPDPRARRGRCATECRRRRSSSPTTRRATRSRHFAPVYVADALPGHVADTKANRPYERRADAASSSAPGPGDPAPLRGDLAGRRPEPLEAPARPPAGVLATPSYVLYRLRLVKVLIVSLYFPPAGGGGVQRTLKTATHLPGARDRDPRARARRPEVGPPRRRARSRRRQAWVHRARYIGPRAACRREELHGKQGLERVGIQARLFGRRLLVPDENVPWNLTAIPAAIRIVKHEGIDVVITTSPPSSVHFVGAAVKRATGAWVADLRDSLVAHPHRRGDESRLAGSRSRASTASRRSSRATPTRSSPPPTRSPRRRAASSRKAAW